MAALRYFCRTDLVDAALMASALERGAQPERENFVGEPEGDDPAAHREDVGVVVGTRETRRIEIVAERGADTDHLVRGDLFALSGTAEHDPSIGGAGCNGAADRDADRRIVDRGIAVRAVIVHCVPER